MSGMVRPSAVVLAALCVLSCAHTHYNLRIALAEGPAAIFPDAAHVVIEDVRPQRERTTHLGKEIWSCERWFGDDTFLPDKLAYLDTLIAERVSPKTPVHIRLERFETVEYCQTTGTSSGSSAARNAGSKGVPSFEAGATTGDRVRLRLAGAINSVPFDVSGTFDYGFLEYTFPETPSSNYTYRALLRDRLDQMADEIVKLMSKS
jgi:hypothetical protein